MLRPEDLFDLEGHKLKGLFDNAEYAWEGLKDLKNYIKANLHPNVAEVRKGKSFIDQDVVIFEGKVFSSGFSIDTAKSSVTMDGKILSGATIIYAGVSLMDDAIYIGPGTIVEPGVLIKGPTIIGDYTEVRQGAYIRGNVLVGDKCVVGHTTEMKSAVMLGESKAGHFAYIGDSILGKVNLGAGTKLANLKIIESTIVLNINNKKYETGLRKFGAILADGVETGCNSVTTPGTILGKNALLYPNGTARGYYPPNSIIKIKQSQEIEIRK
ncbi:MAG: glucose-1-phosphate thymidylyltransferase [bacterium]|nr:glucose-1-phosphate thymidylyltransferase [bacterium]MDD5354509.1 glucose-1-phosphate thymidylyltransferase [bacterium]MDD5756537.1 glucose-1-phosphate thymidylyltransferase [bacterium]